MENEVPYGMRWQDWRVSPAAASEPTHYVPLSNVADRLRLWVEDRSDEGKEQFAQVLITLQKFIRWKLVVASDERGQRAIDALVEYFWEWVVTSRWSASRSR
jgi:hypothetical protein